jgi:hypothetical protein
MLRVHSIESRANAGAGVRSDFANPSKSHRQADRKIKFAPRELAQGGALQVPSRPPCDGAGSGEQQRAGGHDKHPVRHERW